MRLKSNESRLEIDARRFASKRVNVVEPGGFGTVQTHHVSLTNNFDLHFIPCACTKRRSTSVALEDNAAWISRYVVNRSGVVLVQAGGLCGFIDLDFETGVHRDPMLIVVRPRYSVSTRHRHTRITETNENTRVIVRRIV